MGRLPSLVCPLITESAPLLPVSADFPLSVDEVVSEWPPLPEPSGHMDLMPLRSLPVDVPLLTAPAAAAPAMPTPAAPTGTPAQTHRFPPSRSGVCEQLGLLLRADNVRAAAGNSCSMPALKIYSAHNTP